MILVAGGTGTLGTQLVRLLVDRGQDVQVLTRDPTRAAHLPDTVQTMTGDLLDPAAIAAAVRECATVVSAVHGFAGPKTSPSPSWPSCSSPPAANPAAPGTSRCR